MLFCGYGNLAAPIWFLGIEESLGKRTDEPDVLPAAELRVRSRWQPVMDVRLAHEQLDDPYWERRDYSSVWRVMAQLTLAIALNIQDWRDAGLVHRYVIERLGHKGGETFLGELFPLPALSVGTLGLVVNIIVLWNTLYMNKAIEYLRQSGMDVRDEDIARLTPLGYEHIRLIGRYDFTFPKDRDRGRLRPLRRPEQDN